MKSEMSFMENLDVTKFIKLMNYAYSGFYFCRKKSECFGVNVHDGSPSGACFRDSPHRCGKDALAHQCYNSRWKPDVQVLITHWRKIMISNVSQIAFYVDPLQKRLIHLGSGNFDMKNMKSTYRNYSLLSLITCGTKAIPSFANVSHIDKEDSSEHLRVSCGLRINRTNDVAFNTEREDRRYKYANCLLNSIGAGIPTTCGYYLCLNDGINGGNSGGICHDDYFGYLLLIGIGCAIRLGHKHYHYFHAHAFEHNTTVPYVMLNGHINFKDNHVNMVAWGEGNEDSN